MESIKVCGYIVEFYEHPTNPKYYGFRIKNNEEATDALLSLCKRKKVKKEDIFFAKKGLREKIEANYPLVKRQEDFKPVIGNPIITLGEKVQELWGMSISTEVIGKSGPDHCPTITARVTLPDGSFEEAIGSNQKEAKRKAAMKALQRLGLL